MPIKNSVSEIERLNNELNVKGNDILFIKEQVNKAEKEIGGLKNSLSSADTSISDLKKRIEELESKP